jgi:hypothetical protein
MATTMPNPAEQTAPAAPQDTQQQAPPVQAPPVEAPPQLFERTSLEDGKIQVKLNTGEIFTGTPDELVEKLAGSAAHTHVYGKRLKTQLEQFQQQQQPQAPVQQPNQAPVDPAEQMIADIAARSMGFANAAEQRQAYERLNAGQMEIQGRMVANQFMAENPDFAPSDHNSRILTETLAQNGMPETPQTLAMVHQWLKMQNAYEQVAMPPRGPAFQRAQAPPAMPNGSSPQNAPQMTEADLWKMKPEDIAGLMRK